MGERTLTLTNLDKVLYPATGFTKAEVIDYYLRVCPVLLPHLSDRAVTRIRFPNGVSETAQSFYEKNVPSGCPDWVTRQLVQTSEGEVAYVIADSAATVVYLANLASLEVHTPQWRVSSAQPDQGGVITLPGAEESPADPQADLIVVDCDPGPGITMIELARAAVLIATELASDGLLPVAKTSGSKGLQVSAAISPTSCRTARAYVKNLAETLSQRHSELFTAQVDKQQRAGRIFLDYNQNLAARNTIAPYSLRGREQPRIATPLTWEEIAAVSEPDALRFGPAEVIQRIDECGDLAADLLIDDAAELELPAQGEQIS